MQHARAFSNVPLHSGFQNVDEDLARPTNANPDFTSGSVNEPEVKQIKRGSLPFVRPGPLFLTQEDS